MNSSLPKPPNFAFTVISSLMPLFRNCPLWYHRPYGVRLNVRCV